MHPKSVVEYLRRVGAEVVNFRRAMIKTYKGHYYVERAIIKFHDDGSVTCNVREYAPTDEEAAAMKADLLKCNFPRTIRARDTEFLLPKVKGPIFEFWDQASGEIIMVQERGSRNGIKCYIPWVPLSTGEWAAMEPDGPLPFWTPKKARSTNKIMVHEGAKAAAFVQDMVDRGGDGYPWYDVLKEYEHWGMIGGALAPHRTDYDQLAKRSPTDVVYVCDNDQPGVSALQKVSQCWGRSLKGVIFGKKFPESWDMADPMPKTLFARGGRYIGPRLQDLMQAATWATQVIPNPEGKGRPVTIIRSDFSCEWNHCVTPEVFIHKDWPNQVLGLAEFNNRVAPFSHVDDTGRLLKKEFASKGLIMKYIPGEEPGIHGGTEASGPYVNTFWPSSIKPEAGDAGPWIDFLEGLVTDEKDRHELMRWCATLIARPDIKMLYGVLLISEMQGVGKGTLGEKILAPLVGEANVSTPSEQEIVESNYNYWLAHKRLSVVHEIYAGNSSKAYNKLKSCITDKNITVQKKYQANYDIESWIHIFACSNSMRALKLAYDDRRWFVPKISENKRPSSYWEALNSWLTYDGGLNIIKQWAIDFCEKHGAVQKGSSAPWSALKQTIVEEGYSPGQLIALRTVQSIKDKIDAGELPLTVFVLDTQLVELIKHELYDGRQNDRLERPATVRSVAKSIGMYCGEMRAQVKAWGPGSFGARIMSFDKDTAMTSPADLGGEKLSANMKRRPLDLGTSSM